MVGTPLRSVPCGLLASKLPRLDGDELGGFRNGCSHDIDGDLVNCLLILYSRTFTNSAFDVDDEFLNWVVLWGIFQECSPSPRWGLWLEKSIDSSI
jgi:hypothetical protein